MLQLAGWLAGKPPRPMSLSPCTPTRAQLCAARVLVVGDAMLDRYWFGTVDRISPEAPVPVVRITRNEERLGGAANVALNLATLGVTASLMTVLGDDEAGRRLVKLLAHANIAALIEHDVNLRTTVKLRIVARSQQLIRVDFENAPTSDLLLRMLDKYARTVANHSAVVFSDYGKGGLTHLPQMILQARNAGLPVLVDPKGSDYSRYAGATVITPNLAELAEVIGAWTDEAVLVERAQSMRQRLNVQVIVLTRSDKGISLFDDSGHLHLSADARDVFDVTGAGDTVIATLAALIGAGMSARDALPVANRAGGIVVSKFGTAGLRYEELFASGQDLAQ